MEGRLILQARRACTCDIIADEGHVALRVSSVSAVPEEGVKAFVIPRRTRKTSTGPLGGRTYRCWTRMARRHHGHAHHLRLNYTAGGASKPWTPA